MSKKHNKKPKRQKGPKKRIPQIQKRKASAPVDGQLVYYEYNITDEPIDIIKIPHEIEKNLEELYDNVHTQPEQSIDRLEKLIQEYPSVPQLYNYLSVAYSKL